MLIQSKHCALNNMNDLKFALRELRKSPGFTFVAVLTLALGIGVNSAFFALVNGLLLCSPIPVRPEEVVNVFTARQNASHDYRRFSHMEYRELRENRGNVFADVAALEWELAGIGRFYNAEECRPNANLPVVVASYALWKRMGGRQDFVGSKLRINGRSYSVIGITPDGFSGPHALI